MTMPKPSRRPTPSPRKDDMSDRGSKISRTILVSSFFNLILVLSLEVFESRLSIAMHTYYSQLRQLIMHRNNLNVYNVNYYH